MKDQILDILNRLEEFRNKINSGEIQEGPGDWIVRMCEAEIAKGHFETRAEWTELLTKK